MTEAHAFIAYLETLRNDRAALAALRRGLGHPPGTVASMYPYVVPWLPRHGHPRHVAAYYTVAALFAYHPKDGGEGNMGDHLARTRRRGEEDLAVERRFTALLAAHVDDLGFYLRQAIGFLRSKEVPVNWGQLLADILAWNHPHRRVQQQWARSFWGSMPPAGKR